QLPTPNSLNILQLSCLKIAEIHTEGQNWSRRVAPGGKQSGPITAVPSEIQPDKARCVSGNSTEGHPCVAGSARQNFLRKNKAALTGQESGRSICLSIP
uniref:Uncharacterized protein n=1 Tax=Anser cygnoides TaxID=8845 RepID=A0A8B9IJ39_ANSCY